MSESYIIDRVAAEVFLNAQWDGGCRKYFIKGSEDEINLIGWSPSKIQEHCLMCLEKVDYLSYSLSVESILDRPLEPWEDEFDNISDKSSFLLVDKNNSEFRSTGSNPEEAIIKACLKAKGI